MGPLYSVERLFNRVPSIQLRRSAATGVEICTFLLLAAIYSCRCLPFRPHSGKGQDLRVSDCTPLPQFGQTCPVVIVNQPLV